MVAITVAPGRMLRAQISYFPEFQSTWHSFVDDVALCYRIISGSTTRFWGFGIEKEACCRHLETGVVCQYCLYSSICNRNTVLLLFLSTFWLHFNEHFSSTFHFDRNSFSFFVVNFRVFSHSLLTMFSVVGRIFGGWEVQFCCCCCGFN